MSKPNKYNASGMGAQPKLNTKQLYNGPARPGGSQPARIREGVDRAQPGDMGDRPSIRETPHNQHGHTGRVEPSAKQPNGSVHNT